MYLYLCIYVCLHVNIYAAIYPHAACMEFHQSCLACDNNRCMAEFKSDYFALSGQSTCVSHIKKLLLEVASCCRRGATVR